MPKIDCLQKAEKDKEVKAYFSSITEDMSESQQRDMAIELANKYYAELNAEATKFSKSIGHIPKKINQIDRASEIKKLQDEYDAKIKIAEEEVNLIKQNATTTTTTTTTNIAEPTPKATKSSEPIAEQPKSNFSFEPKTNEVLRTPEVVAKDNGGNTIGNITTSLDPRDKNSLVVQSIDVKPGNQNKGVGKQLYLELAKNNPDKTIKSSPRLAGEYAIKAWESLVRDGIAEKVGENKYEIKPKSEVIDKSESISKDYEDISSMKAEKVKREAMDRLISDNFEDIVKQLISNEKIKKLC